MAAVLNQHCSNRNIDYRADHRSNAERGPPAAEPRLPRWNFHHYKRTGKKTSALEGRDRERAARGQIARLENECKESSASWTSRMPNSHPWLINARRRRPDSKYPFRLATIAGNGVVPLEKVSAAPALSVLTDFQRPSHDNVSVQEAG
jgi:hypothetical protein